MRGRLYPLTGQVFIEETDWERFYSPKNLAMAPSVEVAEVPGKSLPETLLTTFSRDRLKSLDGFQSEATHHTT
jgi:hypothetical protein